MIMKQAQRIIEDQEARISHLEYLAATDELTGLLNRKGFYMQFTKELDRSRRRLSLGGLLVLIDVDNYPAIEKIYGELAGKSCLRLVGQTLASEVRAMDSAARLCQDGFVLLLADTTKEDAVGRAQKLAWNLNRLSFIWEGDEVRTHISISLNTYKAGDKPDLIFKEEEIFLYDKTMNYNQGITNRTYSPHTHA